MVRNRLIAGLLGWYPSASQRLTDKDSLILTCTHLPLELLAPRQKQDLAGPCATARALQDDNQLQSGPPGNSSVPRVMNFPKPEGKTNL